MLTHHSKHRSFPWYPNQPKQTSSRQDTFSCFRRKYLTDNESPPATPIVNKQALERLTSGRNEMLQGVIKLVHSQTLKHSMIITFVNSAWETKNVIKYYYATFLARKISSTLITRFHANFFSSSRISNLHLHSLRSKQNEFTVFQRFFLKYKLLVIEFEIVPISHTIKSSEPICCFHKEIIYFIRAIKLSRSQTS